jgi:hypothetical protein
MWKAAPTSTCCGAGRTAEAPGGGKLGRAHQQLLRAEQLPSQDFDAELERVEGGFGLTPSKHFGGLRNLLPALQGLAILDNDGQPRSDRDEGALKIRYWQRYEAENYFITPDLLRRYARMQYPTDDLFAEQSRAAIDEALAETLRDKVFDGNQVRYDTWRQAPADAAD